MYNSKKRIEWIDNAKLFSLLCIMISHGSGFHTKYSFFTTFYIPVFFIASGFFIAKGIETDWRGEIRKKATRLLIPYFFYSFSLLLLRTASDLHNFGRLDNDFWICNFGGILYSRYSLFPVGYDDNIYFMLNYNAPMWFLTAMFAAYILVIPLIRINRLFIKIVIVLSYIGISCYCVACPLLLPWSLDTAPLLSLFYYFGYWVANNKTNLNRKNIIFLWPICLLIYIWTICINSGANISIRYYGNNGSLSMLLYFISGITGSCFVLLTFYLVNNVKVFKKMSVISESSLTAMCTHLFIFSIIKMILKDVEWNFAITLLASIIAIITAEIFYLLCQRGSKKVYYLRFL